MLSPRTAASESPASTSTTKRSFSEYMDPRGPPVESYGPTPAPKSIANSVLDSGAISVTDLRKAQDGGKATKTRSNVACDICRRNKTRCNNDSKYNPCESCVKHNRVCTYKSQSDASRPRDSSISAGIKRESEGEPRKRSRRQDADSARRPSHKVGEDGLDWSVITSPLLEDLLGIYFEHFVTELLFSHRMRLAENLRELIGAHQQEDTAVASGPRDMKLVLLGVLTLTARYHPDLIERYSPSKDKPIHASEHFKRALCTCLGSFADMVRNPSVEKIQALLMLADYESIQLRVREAWMYLVFATGMAQTAGLQGLDRPTTGKPTGIFNNKGRIVEPETKQRNLSPIEKEIRGRTFWSCAQLERHLCNSLDRLKIINIDEIVTQLPCAEEHFSFGDACHTEFLGQLDEHLRHSINHARAEESIVSDTGNEGALIRSHIELVAIWADIRLYSLNGGRKLDRQIPPWDERSLWFKLHEKLRDFHQSLKSKSAYSLEKLKTRLNYYQATASTYVSMQMLYYLCLIYLHRQYVPWIANCSGPKGPIDAPKLPSDEFPPPDPKYWEDSAKQLFQAAANIIEIASVCQRVQKLPESYTNTWAIYTAGFCGVYAVHFPHMDLDSTFVPDGEMEPKYREGRLQIPVKLAFFILKQMKPRTQISGSMLRLLDSQDLYYVNVRKDFRDLEGGGISDYSRVQYTQDEPSTDEPEELARNGSEATEFASRASTSELTLGHPVKEEPAALNQEKPWPAVNAPLRDTQPVDARAINGGGNGYHASSPNGHNRISCQGSVSHMSNVGPRYQPRNSTLGGYTGAQPLRTHSESLQMENYKRYASEHSGSFKSVAEKKEDYVAANLFPWSEFSDVTAFPEVYNEVNEYMQYPVSDEYDSCGPWPYPAHIPNVGLSHQ